VPIREDEGKAAGKKAPSGLSSGLIPIAEEKSAGSLKKDGWKATGLSQGLVPLGEKNEAGGKKDSWRPPGLSGGLIPIGESA